MNKKGNLLMALIIFILCIFLFSIVSIFSYDMFKDIYPVILEDVTLNESKTVLNDTNSRVPSVIDGLIGIIFVGLWIGGIASALAKEEHPIIFGFMMFMIIFVLIAGMWLSNSYEDFMTDDDLSDMPATFPFTNWVLTHIVEVGVMMGLSVLLALLAKSRI